MARLVATRLTEVLALARRPEALLTPAFVARVLWRVHRGPQRRRSSDCTTTTTTT